MNQIDITFDFRSDSFGKDPDSHSDSLIGTCQKSLKRFKKFKSRPAIFNFHY